MEKKKMLNWITDGPVISSEPIPGKFLLELLGEGRILIENHKGVREYGTDKIGIKSDFGVVSIQGKQLELCQMSKERLIISGKIGCITLNRRKC